MNVKPHQFILTQNILPSKKFYRTAPMIGSHKCSSACTPSFCKLDHSRVFTRIIKKNKTVWLAKIVWTFVYEMEWSFTILSTIWWLCSFGQTYLLSTWLNPIISSLHNIKERKEPALTIEKANPFVLIKTNIIRKERGSFSFEFMLTIMHCPVSVIFWKWVWQ